MSNYDPFEPELATRLSALASANAPVPPGGALAARRTAGRRQKARLATITAVAVMLVAAVPLLLSPSETAAPLPASTPQPSASAPTPSVPVPSVPAPSTPVPESVSPSQEPTGEGTAGTAGPPLQVSSTDRGPARAGELADYLPQGFPDESGDGPTGGGITWSLDPCRPTDYPTDDQRTGWFAQSHYIGDGGTSFQVASYPDEAAAQEAIDGMRRAVEACWVLPPDQEAQYLWQPYDLGSGLDLTYREYIPVTDDEQLIDGSVFYRPGGAVSVAREGRVVALYQTVDYPGGGLIARAGGDDRDGSGSPFFAANMSEAEAAQSVTELVERNRQDASRLAADAATHLAQP